MALVFYLRYKIDGLNDYLTSKGDYILMQRKKNLRESTGNNFEFDIYLTTVFEFDDSSTGK